MASEAAELVDRFHSLEQELSGVRKELNDLGIDPYQFDFEDESEGTNA